MNVSTKTLLTVAILGTLGLGVVKTVYANQSKPPVAVVSQHHNNQSQVQEMSDGDGEANDATEPPEQVKQHQTQETDQTEANEGPNDSDSAHEDAQ
jgi:hypothetical protein